jgi:hypothetical protein
MHDAELACGALTQPASVAVEALPSVDLTPH